MLTDKQVYVLENLERIAVCDRQLVTGRKLTRYTLDGADCRQQVNSLAARGFIKKGYQGRLSRLGEGSAPSRRDASDSSARRASPHPTP